MLKMSKAKATQIECPLNRILRGGFVAADLANVDTDE